MVLFIILPVCDYCESVLCPLFLSVLTFGVCFDRCVCVCLIDAISMHLTTPDLAPIADNNEGVVPGCIPLPTFWTDTHIQRERER